MYGERTDHSISYDEAIIKINLEADILMLSFYHPFDYIANFAR